ncbi:MAG: hypothetical protein WBV23_14310 [Desulfobaccales bacterium]
MDTNTPQHIITIPITLVRMATITIRTLKYMWSRKDTWALDTGELRGNLKATVVTATGEGNNGLFRYEDHIRNFLQFLRSFIGGKVSTIPTVQSDTKRAEPWLTLPVYR